MKSSLLRSSSSWTMANLVLRNQHLQQKTASQQIHLHHHPSCPHYGLVSQLRSHHHRMHFGHSRLLSPSETSNQRQRRALSQSLSATDLLQNKPTAHEMKSFLKSRVVDFTDTHSYLKIEIPKHLLDESSNPSLVPPAKWKDLETSMTTFFVDKTTATAVCPELGLIAEWEQFQNFIVIWFRFREGHFKKESPPKFPTFDRVNFSKVEEEVESFWKTLKPINSLTAGEFKSVLKRLKLPLRELELEDFVAFEARVDLKSMDVFFPVRYPYQGLTGGKTVLVGVKRVYFDEATCQVSEDNYPDVQRLASYNNNAVSRLLPIPHGLDPSVQNFKSGRGKQRPSVVVTSSVIDSMILKAKSPSTNAVCLANGASTLPPEHLPFFDNYRPIRFWFSNDVQSSDSALSFAKKVDEKRCETINKNVGSPLDCLRSKKDKVSIPDILKKEFRTIGHENIATFADIRNDVFLEFANIKEMEGVKFKRFDQLNEMIKGFRRGELTIFTGRTGAGKTTFMSEYSLDLCMQGVNTLWGSFEVKNTRLAKTQLKQFSAVALEDNLEKFEYWADRFQKLNMYYLTFHGAQKIEMVLDAMGHAMYVYDIGHVIIDNVQFMMGLGDKPGMDRFYLQDTIIQKFRKFATVHNVHVTLVIHPRKDAEEMLSTNSIFGGAKATQEADNVLLLQDEEVGPRVKRKFVQVVKNRFSGDLGILPLFFNKGTLTFSKKIYLRDKTAAKKSSSTSKAKVIEISKNPLRDSSESSN